MPKLKADKIVRLNTMTTEELHKELQDAYQKLNYYRSNDLSNYIFGKETPNAFELEQAVLASCILTPDLFPIVSDVLNVSDFYSDKHQLIYKAMLKLSEGGNKIDLLTLTNILREKYKKELTDLGLEIYYLVEITNKIGSTANLEYHTRIVKQKAITRDLINTASYALKHAYNEDKDIFDLYDEVNAKTRANNPKAIIRVMSMNEAIKEGLNAKPKRQIIGNLIRERDVTILFGDEGTGKSILAFQMAFSAAEGKALFNMSDDFKNECGKLKVLIFDFELETDELAERYSEKGLPYNFPENCFRADMNPDCLDLENGGDKLLKSVQSNIEKHKPDFVVIDNITWIQDESTDGNVATQFMKKLLTMQKKQGFSSLIVAHTPKRNTSEPLESKHLAGSKGLSNFTKNLIGVSHSKLDPNKRYIKQLKSRSRQKEYFDQVIECALEKEVGSAMLEWKFLAVNAETLHLAAPEQEMSNDEICSIAYRLYHVDGKNWAEIIDEMNLSWHRTTLWRRVEKWAEKNPTKAEVILNKKPIHIKEYEGEFQEEAKLSLNQKLEKNSEKVLS